MWDEFVDLISRPQQAVMGFSKEGSDQLGRTNQWISSKGYDPGYFGPYAVMSTIPAGLKGAWKGLTGQQDYNDWNLAEGATNNPKIDSAINTGVRMTADPLGAFPGVGQSQRAGTALRTAKNLFSSKLNNPRAYEIATQNGLWPALKMDISNAGRANTGESAAELFIRTGTNSPSDIIRANSGFPMVIRQEGNDVTNLANALSKQNYLPPVGGINIKGGVIVGGTGNPEIFRHEMFHNTLEALPSYLREDVSKSAVAPLIMKDPKSFAAQEAFYKQNYSPEKYRAMLGEEMMADLFGKGMPSPSKPGRFVDDLWNVADKRFGHVETGPAKPLAYWADPATVNRARNLWNEE